ncbi:uncharacterized protein LOC117177811 [Belonocnema kinseyi]|uniref:uncharacterized protein LOC117177811 n=1 Tax=Belonocnema kinseyi TaxID=2817044 RepID=UPI00143D60CE|nr:uncharacterized protein LOC117177811 [Belonocnema kinseyi]XP_033224650.1 uncharacterized protein LOC117177811 [Belonocnema kinseyi]
MDSLLPSEIARLVLGYLEDQKCDEAAKTFLETSPHLEECRMVLARGKRFTRTVSDMNLTDILDKYSSIHTLVQEKLSKVPDCEQLKQSGDFLEHLRFLIDASRSQRFVVNINVPTQNAVPTTGGSPIIASSARKRQRSGSDRERDRCKRFAKSQSDVPEKLNNSENIQLYCDTVEATPVESLPGHIESTKSDATGKSSSLKQKSKESLNLSQSGDNEYGTIPYLPETFTGQSENAVPFNQSPPKYENGNNVRCNNGETPSKCTMATSTDELIKSYPSTGVQTAPWDVPDLGRTTSNEPLQNLSLLTKELLNRKELHERIADNINKSFLPSDSSPFKEDAFGANTSFLNLNNSDIVKSIVHATDNDPAFQQFVHDFIKPIAETDTSPDEDLDSVNKPEFVEREKQQELDENILNDMDLTIPEGNDNRIEQMSCSAEVPLKERLRSSSRQQNFRPESEGNKQVEPGKEVKSLEDQNAAAIQSIINANFAYTVPPNIEPPSNKSPEIENNLISAEEGTKEPETKPRDAVPQSKTVDLNLSNSESNDSIQIIESSREVQKIKTERTIFETTVTKSKDKKISKRKETKPVKKVPTEIQEPVPEENIMVMPTLIPCGRNDAGSFLAVVPSYPPTQNVFMPAASNSQFIPIVPKHSKGGVHAPIYCKTVNVPHRVNPDKPKPIVPKIHPESVHVPKKLPQILQKHAPLAFSKLMPVNLSKLVPVTLPSPKPVAVTQNKSLALTITTQTLPKGATITFPIAKTVASTELTAATPVVFAQPIVPAAHVKHQLPKSLPNIELDSCDNFTKPIHIQTESFKDSNWKESNVEVFNFKEENATEIILQEPSPQESAVEASSSASVSDNKNPAIDSITLYANENSKPSLLESAGLPSFSIDDSLSFSISGLSPYLKPKPSKESAIKNVPSCKENINATQNTADTSSVSSIMKRSDMLTKRTPKSLIKSRSKNHRLSLSTPRRRNSHVRALDFGTPAKSSSSVKKSGSKSSPSAHNRSKSACRTSLFKSPPFSNSSPVSSKLKSPEKDARTYKVPIATRSPAPKLKGGWEKYTGVDMILGDNSNSNPPFLDKPESQPPPATPATLRSWDSDLRLALAASVEEPPKKEVRKIVRRVRKSKTPAKGKKRKSLDFKESKKNAKTPAKDEISLEQEVNSSENVTDPTDLTEVASINTTPSSTPSKPQVHQSASKLDEISDPVLKPVEIPPTLKPSTSKISPATISKNMVKIIEKTYGEKIKKYAQLTSVPRTQVKLNAEFLKFSPKNTSKFVKMPNLKDLETPQKLETSSGIPPTPRFLSPTSSSVTPFTKITRAEDSSKLPGMYPTPDCLPPTPSIVFTPNLAGENTKDAINKGGHSSCSPYYQPSSELAEDPEKQLKDDLKKTTEIRTVISTCDTKVTEFQVIKGNLRKEEAAKEELVISSSSIEVSESVTIREEVSSVIQDPDVSAESIDKSSQTSDDESSDSGSNSSSSLSSTSSSSSSGSSITSATQTPLSSAKKNPNKSDKTCTDTSADSLLMTSPGVTQEDPVPVEEEEHFENPESQDHEIHKPEIKDFEIKIPEMKEDSPQKMFSVTNTEDNEETETPAKNDLLLEADISETPSSSKVGTDTPTNLNTKISAIMISNENKLKNMEKKVCTKPTIVSIQRIEEPIDCSALKVAQILANPVDNKPGPSLQGRTANPVDDALRLELEMKRERLKSFLGEQSRGNVRGRGAAGRRGRYSVGRKAVRIVNMKNAKLAPPTEEDRPVENNFELEVETKEEKVSDEEINSETAAEDNDLQTIEESKQSLTSNTKKGKTVKKPKPPKVTAKKENVSESKEPSCEMENKLGSKNKVKDKGEQVESKVKEIVLSLEEQKCAMKAKVDQVKRDLFSDEEVCDQRTTRSKTRQIEDAQKSDTSDQNIDSVKNSTLNSQEILECLQLVPANKSEIHDESSGLQNASDSNQRVYHFVFDERTAVRKRKRKFSQSDLQVYIEGEDGEEDGKFLTNTPYEELFNMLPKPKKRVRKNPVNSIKHAVELGSYEKPLAASSPIFKATISQASGKIVAGKKKDEAGEGDIAKNDKGKAVVEKEKQKGKCRKTKALIVLEQEQDKPTLNAAIPVVLDKLNVDEFLAKLHGPH